MLKETEETMSFVVIIFIVGGTSIVVGSSTPGYAHGAKQVDAT